jgi:hypothetical protein
MKIVEKFNSQKSNITLFRLMFLSTLLFNFQLLKAQPPFETRYGFSSTSNDEAIGEFVTCGSIDPTNYTYAGVHAFKNSSSMPSSIFIRGVRIKADGTMLSANFDFIREFVSALNIFPLKIIPINNNSEYLITGYVTALNTPDRPHPFVIKTDANLTATSFKVFNDHDGFFSDVDELPNQDLLFSGATTYSLKITSFNRLGWIIKTDPTNFTSIWMRYVNGPTSQSSHNYNIVHDAIVVDNDTAFICGTINEAVRCIGNNKDSFQARAFLGKIDLNNGSFVWHKALFAHQLGARLALNAGASLIAFATNAEGNFYPGLSFFDRGGNFIIRRETEVDNGIPNIYGVNFNALGNNYPNVKILVHVPFIQSIYFNSINDADVFVSGKFIKVVVDNLDPPGNQIGEFDMPFSMVYDYNNSTFGTMSLFKSAQLFLMTTPNFLTYDINNGLGCPSDVYPPFYAANNTVPCLSNCQTDEYVTITLDEADIAGVKGQGKVWVFSNDNNVCGWQSDDMLSFCYSCVYDHINVTNSNIEVTPTIENQLFFNSTPSHHLHNCEQ